MTPLSTRAEQATPEETRGLLLELWASHKGQRPDGYIWGTLLDISTPEAHLAAAMMLREEGSEFLLSWSRMSVDMGGKNWRAQVGKHRASGRTAALAVIAAIGKDFG